MSFYDFWKWAAFKIIGDPAVKYHFDNLYPKTTVYYNYKGTGNQDVRMVLYNSPEGYRILSKQARKFRVFKNSKLDCDSTLNNITKWVSDHIYYRTDMQQYGKPEYWSDAYNTYKIKKGDCDDHAILIKNFALLAGIPDWRLKVCWVSVYDKHGAYAGEHLNLVYVDEAHNEEVFIEGTYGRGEYWPGKYGAINFTFNREHAWAQHSIIFTEIDLEGLQ